MQTFPPGRDGRVVAVVDVAGEGPASDFPFRIHRTAGFRPHPHDFPASFFHQHVSISGDACAIGNCYFRDCASSSQQGTGEGTSSLGGPVACSEGSAFGPAQHAAQRRRQTRGWSSCPILPLLPAGPTLSPVGFSGRCVFYMQFIRMCFLSLLSNKACGSV